MYIGTIEKDYRQLLMESAHNSSIPFMPATGGSSDITSTLHGVNAGWWCTMQVSGAQQPCTIEVVHNIGPTNTLNQNCTTFLWVATWAGPNTLCKFMNWKKTYAKNLHP